MKIAVPYWEGKISPVLDTSSRLLVLEFEGKKEVSRYEIALTACDLGLRCDSILQSGAEVLICGAISRPFYRMLTAAHVDVVPWVSGQVEEIVSAYFERTLNRDRFLMPGCRWQAEGNHRERKRRMKQHCPDGQCTENQQKEGRQE
jgi:predicted Fe-Mo cluster-binding NifX family protein